MTFQPWKQAFNNLSNQFYRTNNKNDSELEPSSIMKNGDDEISGPSVSNLNIISHSFEINNDSQQHYQSSITALSQIEGEPSINKTSFGSKFSIFSQLLNLNKINAFDTLLLNSSMSLDDDDLNNEKRQGMKKLMEQAISDEAKQQISLILEKISTLRPAEKLLLYLKMPGGHCEVDPLKQSQNPLGSRSEISHTINWVRSHLEQDDKVSIPKQEVYEDYMNFCGKINIKPLSTADFGKVMKQVFPDIRPRRLGTRGHSRYCYAAMRKATKLSTPFLPDVSMCDGSMARNKPMNNINENEETSWNVIKTWSENILGTHFESINDLASHINTNLIPQPSTSKQILQKKIMQREVKDRKRNTINQPLRRRRKKRRTIASLSPEHFYNTTGVHIKQEKETDGSAIENNDNHSENSSDVPMNLSNTERVGNEQNTSTNSLFQGFSSKCIENEQNETVKSKLKSKILPQITNEIVEQKKDENQFIFCKKVRQAQQMKMSAANNFSSSQLPQTTTTLSQHRNTINEVVNNVITTIDSNKSPTKRKQKRDSINQMMKRPKPPDKPSGDDPINESQLNHVESNDLILKKDDLKDDFILPRERFISICNMDRNALDTYLNNSEENSQDLELSQYFGEDKNNKASECIEEDLGSAMNTVPLLENYQLNFNDNNSKCDNKNVEKLMQLRSILEEKYNNAASSANAVISSNDSVIKNLLLKNPQQLVTTQTSSEDIQSTSTVTSLSQKLQQHEQNLTESNRNYQHNLIASSAGSADKTIPQSPNTRRKNFSFVPIPTQSSRVKNMNLNPLFRMSSNGHNTTLNQTNPFISPRVTSVNNSKRQMHQLLNIRSPNSSLDTSKSIPVLGINNTAFCRPNHFKMEPVSAPPSPSIGVVNHQGFQFSPQAQLHNQFQFNQGVDGTQSSHGTNNNNNNFNFSVESRSQSVPPHCTNNNNVFNNNYNNYSSACNSVAQTPVPSDYQEFSDTNILDIFNNEQPPLSSAIIKIEANDDVISDLLDNDLLNQNSNLSDGADVITSAMRQSFNNLSRSVPSTPLPYQTGNNYNSNNNMNAFCVMGKSVPNTPIVMTANPFRYSPPELQRTRDFLINGFTNNINHNNNNNTIHNDKQLIKTNDSTTIDELDSNLLNNL